MLKHLKRTQSVLWRQPYPVGSQTSTSRRPVHRAHGPQRGRQDHPAAVHHGTAAGEDRACMLFGGKDLTQGAAEERASPRHRLCAAGTADFPTADGGGEPANRPAGPARRLNTIPGLYLRAVPGTQGDARTGAAATCPAGSSSSWPSAGHWSPTPTADPGRTHRGHPAQYRARYRRHHTRLNRRSA